MNATNTIQDRKRPANISFLKGKEMKNSNVSFIYSKIQTEINSQIQDLKINIRTVVDS